MNVFAIDNLKCSYPPNGKPVLFIERLAISKGMMTVILGRSGSGKSTLVEALGLMNNTIQEGNISYFSPGGTENLTHIWLKRRKVAQIRRDYFSFIFQDDYLMPYYTCIENMLITRLIQGKIAQAETARILEQPMDSLDLTGNSMMQRLPAQLAAGQKQRISFIRAVMKEFDVLFGDEPTGNLDYINSEKLFDFIKGVILEKSRSAVIVSHNIELSVDKADRIIVLTPSENPDQSQFRLRPDHIFNRNPDNHWENYYEQKNLISYIKTIL